MDHLVAIDSLDDLVHNARAVPLTGQVRMPLEQLETAVRQVHETLPPELRARLEAEGLLGRLDTLARDARPVPLTDQVRIDKDALYEILDAIRRLVGPERR